MKRRLPCLFLIPLCFLLCACQRGGAIDDAVRSTVLTHVYAETAVALPAGYLFDEFVAATDGGLVLDVRRVEETAAGTQIWYSRWQNYDDGRAPVMLWEYPSTEYPLETIDTEDGTYALWHVMGADGVFYRLTYTDMAGNTTTVESPEMRLGNTTDQIYLDDMHVDDDGFVYLFSSREGVILYDSTLAFQGVWADVKPDGWATQGNTVMLWYRQNGKDRLAAIERDTLTLSSSYPVPPGAKWYFLDSQENLYYHTSEGIYRYTTIETEEGSEVQGEMVLHYSNSNLYDVVSWSMRILDDGRILLAYEEWEPGYVTDIPVVMTPAPDVDLSDVTVLELVTSHNHGATRLEKAIVQFNKKRTDARIVWKDYSGYNTTENPIAGEVQLALDMSTGQIRPDIYFGTPLQEGFSLLLQTENYTDLAPILAADPVYNLDNLVGAVQTTYTVEDKLMAIPLYMATETALVSPAFFADGTTRDSWTITEFLTLANNLSPDAVVRWNWNRNSGLPTLLGLDWYGLFIDTAAGKCDFDSEDFVGLLTLVQNLAGKTSGSRESMETEDNQYIAFQEGRVLTASSRAGSLTGYVQDKRYGEDRLMLGYPTRDGLSGTVLSTDVELFVVTGTCTAPALAWECIREVVSNGERSDYTMPIWKSMMAEAVEEGSKKYHFLSYEGGTVRSESPIELSRDGTYQGEPGMVARLTREDAERYIAWLDTVGRPIERCVIPRAVTAIVEEELSRFIEGAVDAQSCAKAVQSRVQLWLDEMGR